MEDSHKEAIRALYTKVSETLPGFRKRYGQREMVAQIGRTLARARHGDGANITVIEGRTGVGKTVGYLVPSLVMARAKEMKLVISTGTVALQEQLFTRDLPSVVACMETPVTFALLKGRGRFVCPVRLGQLGGGAGQEQMFGDVTWDRRPEDKEIRWLRTVAHDYDEGKWNGEVDTLPSPTPGDLWGRIANNRNTCLGRRCSTYRSCPYFQSLDAVRTADVVVSNHDLTLSCIAAESKLLPEPGSTIYVFDECHHLPSVGVSHFAQELSTGARRWLERLPQAYSRLFAAIPELVTYGGIAGLTKDMAHTLGELETALRHNDALKEKGQFRFPKGILTPQFDSVARRLHNTADDLLALLTSIHDAVENAIKEQPSLSVSLKNALVDAGFSYARVEHFRAAIERFCVESTDEAPLSKWVSAEAGRSGGYGLHVSPILAGPILDELVWSAVGAAVLTSATITTLGSFDFFLRDTGLDAKSQVSTLAVTSPFDYATQGEIVLPRMKVDPSRADDHTAELISLLPSYLDSVRAGALVLFTSKKQMKAVYDAVPAKLQVDVLMQGSQARNDLIAGHCQRVQGGSRSILFGLASFGEGLDLPGPLCEQVLIAKLPFSPPDSPIEEARAEWIEARGGNSFMEVTLPKAGLTLIQWVGRLIRTESDTGRIVLFDTRIRTKRYGGTLLSGLPPFRRVMN